MNRRHVVFASLLVVILAVAVWAVGCAGSEKSASHAEKSSASPAAAASATVEAKADIAGGLSRTKEHLDKAMTELKNKNTKGAAEHIEMAHKEIVPLAEKAPAAVKTAIDAAGQQIETAKGLVERHDNTASAALTKATELVTKASELAKTNLAGAADAAKSMAGSALKSAAETAKPAASAKPVEKK